MRVNAQFKSTAGPSSCRQLLTPNCQCMPAAHLSSTPTVSQQEAEAPQAHQAPACMRTVHNSNLPAQLAAARRQLGVYSCLTATLRHQQLTARLRSWQQSCALPPVASVVAVPAAAAAAYDTCAVPDVKPGSS